MPEYNFITDQIFTVSDFFTAEECDAYIELAESQGFDDAPINTAFGPQIRKDVRNNTRVILDDEIRAAELWSRIPDYIPHTLGRWSACGEMRFVSSFLSPRSADTLWDPRARTASWFGTHQNSETLSWNERNESRMRSTLI